MERTLIKNIEFEKEIKISGWVDKFRDSKNMIFIVLRDITGQVQVTIEKEKCPDIVQNLSGVIVGSVLSFIGKVFKSEYVKMGGMEMLPTSVIVESIAEALPISADANIDQRLAYRWIDLRDKRKTLIFQIATDAEMFMREFLVNNNFIEIHTPKLSALSSEGGAEVFKLDYFGQPVYLTQSPQFYKQMAMSAGFEKVFEFGDCFRAEQSFTARHATEFESFDLEMSYINSHDDVMDIEEKMLTEILKKLNEKYGEIIKENFQIDIKVPSVNFPRIKYVDALKILKEKYNYVGSANDFDTESERLICDYALKTFDSEFVFITDYPTNQRAFYTMINDNNPDYSKSFDLLWKDQEITSGAQREHRANNLIENIKRKNLNPDNLKGYVDFFRYGCPPHGGFAIGMARLIAKLLNLSSIKESTFIFRGPTKILP